MQLATANENLAGLVTCDVLQQNWVSAEPEAVFAYYERTRALPNRGLRAVELGADVDGFIDHDWAEVVDLRGRKEEGERLNADEIALPEQYAGMKAPALIDSDGHCVHFYEAHTAVRDGLGRQTVLTGLDIVGRGDGFRANMEKLTKQLDAAGIMFEEVPIHHDFVVLGVGCSFDSVGPEMKNSAETVLRTVIQAEDELMAVLRRAHKDGLLRGAVFNTQGPEF